MSARTPTRRTPKKEQLCDDVDLEFCKRALALMASFYDSPVTDPITTFPPVNPSKEKVSQEKKVEFDSGVVDLRLSRRQAQNQAQFEKLQKQFEEDIQKTQEQLLNSKVDIDDAFEPERGERPETPRYLVNQQKDDEERGRRARVYRKPVDMAAMTQEFTKRAEEAKKKGEQRAQLRYQKMHQGERPKTPSKIPKPTGTPRTQNAYESQKAAAQVKRQRQQEYAQKTYGKKSE